MGSGVPISSVNLALSRRPEVKPRSNSGLMGRAAQLGQGGKRTRSDMGRTNLIGGIRRGVSQKGGFAILAASLCDCETLGYALDLPMRMHFCGKCQIRTPPLTNPPLDPPDLSAMTLGFLFSLRQLKVMHRPFCLSERAQPGSNSCLQGRNPKVSPSSHMSSVSAMPGL